MFISLGLALLCQSSIVAAQEAKMGSGLAVYPNTGPLAIFKGISWRHNGELRPWGTNDDLEFVSTIRDEAAVQEVEADALLWHDIPDTTSVFSLELRKRHIVTGGDSSADL